MDASSRTKNPFPGMAEILKGRPKIAPSKIPWSAQFILREEIPMTNPIRALFATVAARI